MIADIKNTGTEPVSDCRSSSRRHRERQEGSAQRRTGPPYFQTHLPAIGAGQTITWIYVAKKFESDATDAFAEVGKAPAPPVTPIPSIPGHRGRCAGRDPKDPSKVADDGVERCRLHAVRPAGLRLGDEG